MSATSFSLHSVEVKLAQLKEHLKIIAYKHRRPLRQKTFADSDEEVRSLTSAFRLSHFSPALRKAARCCSRTTGSRIGIRCLCTFNEKLGFSRRTSAASARASATWPNSL